MEEYVNISQENSFITVDAPVLRGSTAVRINRPHSYLAIHPKQTTWVPPHTGLISHVNNSW